MKSIKLIIVMAAFLFFGVGAARAALDFPSVPTYSPGKSALLTVGATTPNGTSAMQFTVTLPDGFILGSTTVTLEKSRATDHIYRLNKVSDSSYRCVIYSNNNTPFASTSGNLFSLTLKAATTATKGDYALSFTEIRCADALGKETDMPDATANLSVIIPAKSVAVSPSPADILVGESLKLTATVSPAEASQEVTWSSSNTSKVTVSEDGTVTGIAVGYATVTAKTTDGSNRSASCRVNVSKVGVTQVVMSRETLDMYNGTTASLTATVFPENATEKGLTWTTSNPQVVSVDNDGNLRARSAGTATITVTSVDNPSARATCRVTVLNSLATSLTVKPSTLSLRVNDTSTLSVTVTPSDASKNVKWSSSDASVVSVSETGTVTAQNVGNAVITATTLDGTALTSQCIVTVQPALVTSVKIDQTDHDLFIGDSEDLTATVLPENAGNRSLKWESSDSRVATVDDKGHVVALAAGTVTITATTTDGSNLSDKCLIKVNKIGVTQVVMSRETLDMYNGTTASLTATVFPENATEKGLAWTTSNPQVVSVDNDGNLRARSAGTATITVTSVDNPSARATCRVTVLNSLATSLTVEPPTLSLRVNDTSTLSVSVTPSDASKNVKWSSSDASVVSVSETGTVTALNVGNAVITATTLDGTDLTSQCIVTVQPALVTSVKIDQTDHDLFIGDSEDLTATVLPENAGNRKLQWESSDSRVATVDAKGHVVALAAGTVTITATTTDGSDLSDQCRIKVNKIGVTQVVMSRETLDMYNGTTASLTATVLPENATEKGLTWTTSNPQVVSVDNDGNLRARSAGTATITVTSVDNPSARATCRVTVLNSLATSLTVNPATLSLRVNDTATLSVSVAPSDASKNVKWGSSDASVVLVSETGTVTALNVGTAVITATTLDGTDLTSQCSVTVQPALVTSVKIDQGDHDLFIGESEDLTATVLPENAGNRKLQWESSDSRVATVDDNGHVVALAAGTVTITATTTDGSNLSDKCRINVVLPQAESITLDCDKLDLETGDSYQLTVSILPAEALQTARFNSSDPAVASVDENGKVMAIAPGVAAIIATTTDGTGLTDVCMVTVKEKLAIGDVKADMPVVTACGQEIIISGVDDSVEVRVTDASGTVVYQGLDRRIGGLSDGFHIVIVGRHAYKVVLR